jgi:predicted transcriptional regulator
MLQLRGIDDIPEILEKMRSQLGWTKKQLAANTGFSYKQLLYWVETGYSSASLARVNKIFQVMSDALEKNSQGE